MKVEKVLRFHLLLLPIPKLTCKVNLNILIRCYVYYISAQVADFMSSVGNRLIGGKSTVAVENCIGQFFSFYTHFKMAATYRCRLVTSINTRFSTGIYQKNLLLLPVKMPL